MGDVDCIYLLWKIFSSTNGAAIIFTTAPQAGAINEVIQTYKGIMSHIAGVDLLTVLSHDMSAGCIAMRL